jgi:UDP-N-acetylglucosamine diphosphorylase/glucosamine-1-phosphate N-acetyltransferase
MRTFATASVGALIRPELAELCRRRHPEMAVNDADWLNAGPVVWVNARWFLPGKTPSHLAEPHIGWIDGQIAYIVPPPGRCPENVQHELPEILERWRQDLPTHPAEGRLLKHPWDLHECISDAIAQDFATWCWKKDYQGSESAFVLGPAAMIVVAPGARIEPQTVLDTTHGPILIDRRAVIEAFSRLDGPCYIGPDSVIRGARISGSTIGPNCRVGGEVEASVLQGYANKAHDGFLGHSYLGEWVNLGAGTQVADLRTDYRTIRVTVGNGATDTQLLKVGAFLADHAKTGIGTLLNAGASVGAFCQLLASGELLPRDIPSFCRYRGGRLDERSDLRSLFDTAATAMRRRGCSWTDAHQEFFFGLNERTLDDRHRFLHQDAPRRLRSAV